MNPLRGSAWSMCAKTEGFSDSEYARATLCEDRARRSALAVAPCEFVAGEVVFGSRGCSRQKSQLLIARVVRGRWKIATFRYNYSARSTVLQLRLHNGTFQSENQYAKYFPKAPAALAQSNLHRALPIAQSNLRKANCTEHVHIAASAGQLGQTKSQVLCWENYYHESHCTESS